MIQQLSITSMSIIYILLNFYDLFYSYDNDTTNNYNDSTTNNDYQQQPDSFQYDTNNDGGNYDYGGGAGKKNF